MSNLNGTIMTYFSWYFQPVLLLLVVHQPELGLELPPRLLALSKIIIECVFIHHTVVTLTLTVAA